MLLLLQSETSQIWQIKGYKLILSLINRCVTLEEGVAKAKEHEILFSEVSAKSDFNVQNLFKTLATHLTGSDASTFNESRIPATNKEQDSKLE